MELSKRNKVIILIVYTAVAVASGRFLTPEKIKIEKQIVKEEVNVERKDDKEKTDTNRAIHVKKTIVEKTLPDGTKEKTTNITADNTARTTKTIDDKSTNIDTKKETSTETKEVSRTGGRTNVDVIAAFNIQSPSTGLIYGAHVSHTILGPISLGILGLSNGTAGASIGLNF